MTSVIKSASEPLFNANQGSPSMTIDKGDLTFSKEWTHDDPFQSCRSSIWRDCSQAVCPMTGKQSEAHLDLTQWTSVEAVAMGGILAGVVSGEPVFVWRSESQLKAYGANCPHLSGPLDKEILTDGSSAARGTMPASALRPARLRRRQLSTP